MSSLAADVAFHFAFPPCEPATPPTAAASSFYDASSYGAALLDVPFAHHRSLSAHGHGHARSASQCSTYSAYSFASSPSESLLGVSGSAHTTPGTHPDSTPARSPIRTHGPLLLPKIRSQDQALGVDPSCGRAGSPPKRQRTSSIPPAAAPRSRSSAASRRRPAQPAAARHARSFTSPDAGALMARPLSALESTPLPPTLLCSPVPFVQQHDGALALDDRLDDGRHDGDLAKLDYGFAPYPGTVPGSTAVSGVPMPSLAGVSAAAAAVAAATGLFDSAYYFPQHQHHYDPRAASPFSVDSVSASATPEPMLPPPAPSNLLTYLTAANPAPALVRTISFPLRDPHTKHFWWDVRQVTPWSAFSARGLLALPGATAVLTHPVPAALLPATPSSAGRQRPETEAELQGIYAAHYLPRVNAALAFSSPRPVQLQAAADGFVGHTAGDASSAAALFGGMPTARVVGLVKSFDRFNTGMRVEGNVKKVEYLRGLAHLHHRMREHSCRYGFILTEIELVVVRNGTEATPLFGQMEVASVPLATAVDAAVGESDTAATPLTACMALWGLCMLATDEMAVAATTAAAGSLLCAHHTHIGAPAEGTRRKAAQRDAWMPPPQLAEKRAAKRARGWVMPEDVVGRKEMGRRGVRYSGSQ